MHSYRFLFKTPKGEVPTVSERAVHRAKKFAELLKQLRSSIVKPVFESENLKKELAEIPSKTPYKIIMDKSDYQIYVFHKGKLIKQYSATHGHAFSNEKTKRKDKATPEGIYFITHHNNKSKYHLSLGISYPNAIDAKAGLDSNIISAAQYQQIKRRHNAFRKPPQNTALGGDIFIHGESGGKTATIAQWTQGCIRVSNEDIEEIFKIVPNGTGIKIRK